MGITNMTKVDSTNIVLETKPPLLQAQTTENNKIEVFSTDCIKANIDEVNFSGKTNVSPENKTDDKKKWLIKTGITLGVITLTVAGAIVFKKRMPKIANKYLNHIKNDKNFKSFITNLDPQTVKRLETCPIEDFYIEAQKIITKAYKIPEELVAPMQLNPTLSKKISASYDFTQNIVNINPQSANKSSRKNLFAIISHEYIHQKQNLEILRTEGLGEDAVKFYAELLNKNITDDFINSFSKISKEDLLKLKPELGDSYKWAEELQEAAQKGPEHIEKFKNKLSNHNFPIFLENLTNFRQNITKKLGSIPRKSNRGEFAQTYFNDFRRTLYDQYNLKSLSEKQAYTATATTSLEYMLNNLIPIKT